MRKIIHWIISIVSAAVIAVVAIGCVIGLGYALYLMFTEATIVVCLVVVMAIVCWVGSYLEKHGFAWNPKSDCE